MYRVINIFQFPLLIYANKMMIYDDNTQFCPTYLYNYNSYDFKETKRERRNIFDRRKPKILFPKE